MLWIPLAVTAGISAVQTIGGFIKNNRARKRLDEMEDLDYTESDAYKTAQTSANLAGRYAQEGIPEQSFRFQEDMIGRSGAASLASAGSLRQGTTGIGASAIGLADQYRGLASMDAQQRVANRGQFFSQLGNLQGQQAQAFDYQMGYDMLKRSQELGQMTAGQSMVNSGLSGLASAGGAAISGGFFPGNAQGGGGAIPGAGGVESGLMGNYFGPYSTQPGMFQPPNK